MSAGLVSEAARLAQERADHDRWFAALTTFGGDSWHWAGWMARAALANEHREELHRFLDAAAGEGLVLDGIDAAELYQKLFPLEYARAADEPQGGAQEVPR